MTKNTLPTVGTRVQVTQTRSHLGKTGTVTEVFPDTLGTAGDALITIADDNGGTFHVYDRQVKTIQ